MSRFDAGGASGGSSNTSGDADSNTGSGTDSSTDTSTDTEPATGSPGTVEGPSSTADPTPSRSPAPDPSPSPAPDPDPAPGPSTNQPQDTPTSGDVSSGTSSPQTDPAPGSPGTVDQPDGQPPADSTPSRTGPAPSPGPGTAPDPATDSAPSPGTATGTRSRPPDDFAETPSQESFRENPDVRNRDEAFGDPRDPAADRAPGDAGFVEGRADEPMQFPTSEPRTPDPESQAPGSPGQRTMPDEEFRFPTSEPRTPEPENPAPGDPGQRSAPTDEPMLGPVSRPSSATDDQRGTPGDPGGQLRPDQQPDPDQGEPPTMTDRFVTTQGPPVDNQSDTGGSTADQQPEDVDAGPGEGEGFLPQTTFSDPLGGVESVQGVRESFSTFGPVETIGELQQGVELIDPDRGFSEEEAQEAVRSTSRDAVGAFADPVESLVEGPDATRFGMSVGGGSVVGRRPMGGPVTVPGPFGAAGTASRVSRLPSILRSGATLSRSGTRTAATGADVARAVGRQGEFVAAGVDGLIRAGGLAGGAAVASELPAQSPVQDVEEVEPGETVPQSEVETGEPVTDASELGVPDEPAGPTGEVPPSELFDSELDVVDDTTDEAPLSTAPEQRGAFRDPLEEEPEQTDDQPFIGRDDIPTEVPQPDQPGPSVREQIRRDDLVAPRRDFFTGGGAVVGRGEERAAEQPQIGFPAWQQPLLEQEESELVGGAEDLSLFGDGGAGTGVVAGALERREQAQTLLQPPQSDEALDEAERGTQRQRQGALGLAGAQLGVGALAIADVGLLPGLAADQRLGQAAEQSAAQQSEATTAETVNEFARPYEYGQGRPGRSGRSSTRQPDPLFPDLRGDSRKDEREDAPRAPETTPFRNPIAGFGAGVFGGAADGGFGGATPGVDADGSGSDSTDSDVTGLFGGFGR